VVGVWMVACAITGHRIVWVRRDLLIITQDKKDMELLERVQRRATKIV